MTDAARPKRPRRAWWIGLAVAALLPLPAGEANAQIPWESPQLIRPGSQAGLSLLFVDYGLEPYRGRGAALVLRSHAAPRGFALRASAAHGSGDRLPFADGNVNLAAGFEFSDPLLRSTHFPLDVLWTWGIGGSYGEHVQIALPIGIAGGRAISSRVVRFNPYASARAVLEGRIASSVIDEDLSLGLAIDAGADLSLGQSGDFQLQVAVSFGDRHAAAIGLHIGGGSPITTTRTAPPPARR